MNEDFKPPADPALHAIWVIRNWTMLPKGNLNTWQDIVMRVNRLASETYEELSKEKEYQG